jgi:predicted outer membrane repeat protein
MSLREAMDLASYVGGKVIFDLTLFSTPQTIKLSSDVRGRYGTAEISIDFGLGLSVVGPTDANGNNLVTIDGGGANQVLGGGGSWISFYDSTNSSLRGPASFSDLNFTNCIGGGDANHIGGGAINYAGDFSSTLTLNNCNFSGNSDINGGAVDLQSGAGLNVSNCTFSNNSATGGLSGNGYGGAIYSSSPVNIKNCSFSNNTAVLGGGALADSFTTGSITISSSTFSGNTSSGSGGAIYSTVNTSISNSNVTLNTAFSSGGGIWVDPTLLTIISSTVTGNSAPTGADLNNTNSTVTLTNSTVTNISNNGGTITTPDSAATNLDTQISALASAGTLTASQASGLTSKVTAADQSLNNGKLTPAVNELNAFINQLNAFVKSGTVTSAQGQPLIDGANQLISAANIGGAHLLNDPGNTTTTDTQPVTDAGQLVTGPVGVYLANADGTPVPADEQGRLDDAITALDTTFGPNGVDLVDVGVANAANAVVQVQIADISATGSAADGVLGCTVAGQITLLTGWNWFTGADPTAIGTGQYDFETIVMHELGHAIGLGHSGDTNSVMYAYLAPGQTRRVVTAADLSVLDSPSTAPEPLLAAPWHDAPRSDDPGRRVAIVPTPATVMAPIPLGTNIAGRDAFFALLVGQSPASALMHDGKFNQPDSDAVSAARIENDPATRGLVDSSANMPAIGGTPMFGAASLGSDEAAIFGTLLFSDPLQDGRTDDAGPSKPAGSQPDGEIDFLPNLVVIWLES